MTLTSVANSLRHNKNLNRLITAMKDGIRVNHNRSPSDWRFSPLELEVAKDWGILLRQEFRMTYQCYIPFVWHVRFAKEIAYDYGLEGIIETPDNVPQKSLSKILESLGIEWFTEEDVRDIPFHELVNYGYYVKHEQNYWLLIPALYSISADEEREEIAKKFLKGFGYKV